MNRFMINGIEYPFTKEIIKDMENNNITKKVIKDRVRAGWTFYEAVNVPKNMSLKTFRDLRRKGEIANRSFNKLLKRSIDREKLKKPHLYSVPQPPYKCDEYAKSLIKNNTIAKLKIDLYGQPQLV